MNSELTRPTTKSAVIEFDPNQYSVVNKIDLLLAFDPKAGELYNRVRSMPVSDINHPSLADEVQTLDTEDFTMVGQLFNLFRI